MANRRFLGRSCLRRLGFAGLVGTFGCYHTPIETSEFSEGPAPLRMPSPGLGRGEWCSYEDDLTGGHIFELYCSSCHEARSLAERPFSSYQNVAAHMRVRANLTGKEYAKLLEWMRQWHDVPPPNPTVEPSPKRLTFWEPLDQLRGGTPAPPQPSPAPAETPSVSPPETPTPESQLQQNDGNSVHPFQVTDSPFSRRSLRFGGTH